MEIIEDLLAQFREGYTEDVAKKLGASGDQRALAPLINALMSTQQMDYPRYKGEWYQLSAEERARYKDLERTFSLNWLKRVNLVRALGALTDPRALPELEDLLSDTDELDAWGAGVSISVSEVAQSAIQKIKTAHPHG